MACSPSPKFPADRTALRPRLLGLFGALIAGNLAAWAWALVAFRDHPVLLGTALLAYGLGLRHAVDADHIAAIDNTTRKLMQEGQRPLAVGLWFSLGHSTVVALASAAVALGASALTGRFAGLKALGGVIGISVSALFLIAIAVANLLVFAGIYRTLWRVRRGEVPAAADLDILLARRGLLGRIFRPLFRLVARSWHLYPLGVLFGLGFDTASEIGLLGISAAEATRGLSLWSILIFPALFTAGMALVDAADGALMLGVYGWGFARPIRRLYYNLAVTLASALIALVIGGVEALGLLAGRLQLRGAFWDAIAAADGHLGALGYAVVGLFALSWIASLAISRIRGSGRLRLDGSGAD